MKINKFISLSLFFLIGAVNSYAQKVSNISSRQEQNTIIVSYDLDTPTPCKISLYVSTDGGNIWQGPLKKIDSNYTESVTKGTHEIIWNVLEEFDKLSGDNIVFQIKADNNETKKSNYLPDTNQKKIYLAEIEKLNKTIKLNPKNASAFKARAALRIKFRSGLWDDLAILDYNKAIQINPNDASAYKARAVLRKWDYKIAIKDINKSILLNPHDSQNFIIRAFIIESVIRDSTIVNLSYQDVINDYTKSINLNPKEGLSYLLRAKCKIELKKDYTGALNDVDIALALGSNDVELSHNLFADDYFAHCYFVKGNIYYQLSNKTDTNLINQSIENFNSYISLEGFNWSTLSTIYYDFYNDSNYKSVYNSMEFLNQLISKFPTEEYTYLFRSSIAIDNNDFTKAEADINEFLDLSKTNNREILFNDFYFIDKLIEKNQNVLAKNILDKAIKLFPIQAYIKMGELKTQLKDYAGAVKDFTQAISFEPKRSDAYYKRGSAKQSLSDYIGAMEDYSKAIIFDPEEWYYHARASVKQDLNDNRGAILDYNKAIQIDPKSSYHYNSRGNAKYNIKDYKGAILDYTKAISLDPKEGEYYFNRGDAKIQIKDKIGGCKDLSKAGELGYNEAYSLINQHCN